MRRDQSRSDHLEVLRDLSTYEVNFCKHSYGDDDKFAPLAQRLKDRITLIEAIRTKLKMRIFLEDGEEGEEADIEPDDSD